MDFSDPKNRIRFLCQDTDETDQLVQDEEIGLALEDEGGNVFRAASAVCSAIALQLGRQLTLKGKVELDADQQHKHYLTLAETYRRKAARAGVSPTAGGLSKAAKRTSAASSDRVQPAFTRDLHDVPETSFPEGGR